MPRYEAVVRVRTDDATSSTINDLDDELARYRGADGGGSVTVSPDDPAALLLGLELDADDQLGAEESARERAAVVLFDTGFSSRTATIESVEVRPA